MTAGDHPVVLAAVAGAHGVRGEVRLKLFTESAATLSRYQSLDAAGRTLSLRMARDAPGGAIARFAEIADRSAAEALRGTLLSVPRSRLPPLAEGERYWHDFLGREVVDDTGKPVGTVSSVENYGASDLLEVTRGDGTQVLVPLLPEAVTETGAQLRVGREWLA